MSRFKKNSTSTASVTFSHDYNEQLYDFKQVASRDTNENKLSLHGVFKERITTAMIIYYCMFFKSF